MKLYWFWSFNPQKVRLALHELGVAHDLATVDLFRGQGESFTLVDCALGPLLDALSLSRFDLATYAGVNDYLARLRARPAWGKCDFKTGAQ